MKRWLIFFWLWSFSFPGSSQAFSCIADTIPFSHSEKALQVMTYLQGLKKDTTLTDFQIEGDALFIRTKDSLHFSGDYVYLPESPYHYFWYEKPPEGILDVIPWLFTKAEKLLCVKDAHLDISGTEKDGHIKTVHIQVYPKIVENADYFLNDLKSLFKGNRLKDYVDLRFDFENLIADRMNSNQSHTSALKKTQNLHALLWRYRSIVDSVYQRQKRTPEYDFFTFSDLALLINLDHFFSFDFRLDLQNQTCIFEMCFQYSEAYRLFSDRPKDDYDKLLEVILEKIITLFEP